MNPIPSGSDSKSRIELRKASGLPSFCSGMVLVLEAYFDESGSSLDQRPILVLGGYIAPYEQWVEFSQGWLSVLKNYAVPYFHATELPSRHSKLYGHLSKEQKKAFVSELIAVIGKYVDMGVSIIMTPDDWRLSTTDTFRCKHGSAYGICMELLLMLASVSLRKPGEEPQRVSVFLEDGHKNSGDAILRASNYKADTEPLEVPPGANVTQWLDDLPRTRFMRIGSIGLVPKITTLPVQAADLFTYLVSNLLRPTGHYIFQDCLGELASLKPHWYSAWNTQKVKLLVDTIKLGTEIGEERNQDAWRLSGALRALGLKTRILQGGLAIDGRGRNASITEEQWNEIFEVHGFPPPEIK